MAAWATWSVAALALLASGIGAAIGAGGRRYAKASQACRQRLLDSQTAPQLTTVDFGDIAALPEPVRRYFHHVLADCQPLIRVARYRQQGELRTDIASARWMPFAAVQTVAPCAHGFVWDARVELPSPLHLRVRDAYLDGQGSDAVALMSAFTLARQAGGVEMNSGALMRYLAEAVWYPTALLPAAGVTWSAIDDSRALATLTDRGTTVSVEFRFDEEGCIVGVYAPERWRSVKGGFERAAWEGHFRDYRHIAGMRVPAEGEVGWYDAHGWHAVWKGRIRDAAYEFFPTENQTKGKQ